MGANTLELAVKYALQNPIKKLPRMAAILCAEGHEIVGFNSLKSHPLAKRFGRNSNAICLHAEIDAIRRCLSLGINPRNGVMYVARVTRDGRPALAKPCPGCQAAIVAFQLKHVFWTTGENDQ